MSNINIVQAATDGSAGKRTSTQLTFSQPISGHLLVVMISAYYNGSDTYDFSLPIGWSRFANPYNVDPSPGVVGPQVFTRVSDGTETSVTFSRDGNSFISSAFFEISGPSGGVDIDAYSVGARATPPDGKIYFESITPSAENTLALAACGWRGSNTAPIFSIKPGWTTETQADSNVYYQLMTGAQQQDASLTTVTGWMQQENGQEGPRYEGGTVMLLFAPKGSTGLTTTLTTTPTASVSDTTARVSFRAAAASAVAIKYAANTTLTGATTTPGVVVDSAADFTGKVDIAGLAKNTLYYYTLIIDGEEKISSPYPSFRTFPINGSPEKFSFAFGSCTKHSDAIGADDIFNVVPSDVKFMMHLGDLVYADRDPPKGSTLSIYREQHRSSLTGDDLTTQGWASLRARTPVFTTWDDHDLKNDYDEGTNTSLYSNAKQGFQEYSARANPDSMQTGELYYTFQVGDVGFFVLDGRSFRDRNSATDNGSKTYLGLEQKAALKNWLISNKEHIVLKFICSSTPAHGYAANTGSDSWGGVDDSTQQPSGNNGFRTERNEIWDFIDANDIPGVITISGDQHWAGAFKTTYANRPRYEFMSTPLNMTDNSLFMLTAVSRAADSLNGPVLWKKEQTMNMGVVSVDTTVTPATVSFQLYDPTGSLGASYLTELNLDQIEAGNVPFLLSGDIAGVSSLSGRLSLLTEMLLSGQITASSLTVGDLSMLLAMAGQVSGVSQAQGLAALDQSIAGQIDGRSNITAALALIGQMLLTGTIQGQSIADGNLSLDTALTGEIGSVSDLFGQAWLDMVLSGQIQAASDLEGVLAVITGGTGYLTVSNITITPALRAALNIKPN